MCKLRHIRPFIGIFDQENSKNCKMPKTKTTWHGTLNLSHKARKKLWPFQRCRQITCSQTKLSSLPEHAPLSMVFSWTLLNWPQLLPPGGHTYTRHLCEVWMTSNTVCKLQDVRPFISLVDQENLKKCKTSWKPKQLGIGALNCSKKAIEKIWVTW